MGVTEGIQDLERNPFYLKRKGQFDKALVEYVVRFARAQESGNNFVSATCYDQIFDIHLLLYAKHQSSFNSLQQLRYQLKKDVHEALGTEQAIPTQALERFFESCWRRFSPRGRGQTRFSVDRQTLVPSSRIREQEQRNHE